MKKFFSIIAVALLSLSASAQQTDTIPPVEKNIDSILHPDTAMKRWHGTDSNMAQRKWNSTDSNMSNRGDTNRKWHRDSALTGWNKHDSIMKRQADSTHMQHHADSTAPKEKIADRAIMKDGEMVVEKNGVAMKMEKDITLPSGTIIKIDGTVKKKDGSETKLKDGQFITLPAVDSKKKTATEKKKDKPLKKNSTINKTKQ